MKIAFAGKDSPDSYLPNSTVSVFRVFGLGSYLAWVFMLFYMTKAYPAGVELRDMLYMNQTLSTLALALGLVICGQFASRHPDFTIAKPLVIAASCVMFLGSACIIVDLLAPFGYVESIVIVSGLLTGFSTSVILASWGVAIIPSTARTRIVECALAFSGALFNCFILVFLPDFFTLLLILVTPLATGSLALYCLNRTAPLVLVPAADKDSAAIRRLTLHACVSALFFGLVAGFLDVLSGYRILTVGELYDSVLLLLAALCALLILFIALLVKRDALIMCYRSAIFLVILGCLLTPFMSDGFTYPNAIIVGGYISFQIVAFALSGTFVKKLGISPLRCLCAGFGALYIGETCGLLTCLIVSTFFPLSTMTVFVIAILLAACLLFSCLFLLSERDFIDFSFSLPTTKDANKPSRATGVPLSPEETQIMFAEEFGLTNRELEVFGLVAQGRSNARIQEELYISAGTVSTHINHIYRKCGVSNKQDLLDIIQERQGIYK